MTLQSGSRKVVIVLLLMAGLGVALAQTRPDGTQAASGAAVKAVRIDLNRASADELKALPEIGEIGAKKILAGRPYRNPQELVSKGILSKDAFNQIKDRVAVGQTNPWRP
jgi:DNA uptake protein ComE-like DNA-binding protein